MTGQLLIGLCGLTDSGKTTVARRLVEAHGFGRVGFGDALKDEVACILRRPLKAYLRAIRPDLRTRDDLGGIEEAQWDQYLYAALWETRDEFCRTLLQAWGTELRRAETPDYWVRAWEQRIVTLTRVVNDNVRFVNEAEAIRRLGGFLVKVTRVGYGPVSGSHRSEDALSEWADFDFSLKNDGDLTDLAAETDRIAKAIFATTNAITLTTESRQP